MVDASLTVIVVTESLIDPLRVVDVKSVVGFRGIVLINNFLL